MDTTTTTKAATTMKEKKPHTHIYSFFFLFFFSVFCFFFNFEVEVNDLFRWRCAFRHEKHERFKLNVKQPTRCLHKTHTNKQTTVVSPVGRIKVFDFWCRCRWRCLCRWNGRLVDDSGVWIVDLTYWYDFILWSDRFTDSCMGRMLHGRFPGSRLGHSDCIARESKWPELSFANQQSLIGLRAEKVNNRRDIVAQCGGHSVARLSCALSRARAHTRPNEYLLFWSLPSEYKLADFRFSTRRIIRILFQIFLIWLHLNGR